MIFMLGRGEPTAYLVPGGQEAEEARESRGGDEEAQGPGAREVNRRN